MTRRRTANKRTTSEAKTIPLRPFGGVISVRSACAAQQPQPPSSFLLPVCLLFLLPAVVFHVASLFSRAETVAPASRSHRHCSGRRHPRARVVGWCLIERGGLVWLEERSAWSAALRCDGQWGGDAGPMNDCRSASQSVGVESSAVRSILLLGEALLRAVSAAQRDQMGRDGTAARRAEPSRAATHTHRTALMRLVSALRCAD